MSEKKHICPQCEGSGRIESLKPTKGILECDLCEGYGYISGNILAQTAQGKALREWRVNQGLTLRQCSNLYNLDPVILSEMERGVREPLKYYNQKKIYDIN